MERGLGGEASQFHIPPAGYSIQRITEEIK
jgi:hypothetical protein